LLHKDIDPHLQSPDLKSIVRPRTRELGRSASPGGEVSGTLLANSNSRIDVGEQAQPCAIGDLSHEVHGRSDA